MHEFRQIISRLRLGQSNRDIARAEGVGRKTVAKVRREAQARGWLEATRELPEERALAEVFGQREARAQTVSSIVPFREQVLKWHASGIQGTTIHQALERQYGYRGSYSAVRRFLQALPREPRQATVILEFAPGEAAQVDFGAGPKITDRVTGEVISTWVFVATLAWSRHQYAEIVRDQTVETWLLCHRHAFEFWNGVVSKVILDNAKCAIIRACRYEPEAQRSYAGLAEAYGFLISACPPRRPELKGRVESGVKYIKANFLPLREFHSLAHANAQLREWIMGTAGNRTHGSTQQRPLTQFLDLEQALLKPLPAVAPEVPVWAKALLAGNCHVQHSKVLYSAPYRLIGKSLWLRISASTMQIFHEHELVAIHPRKHKPGDRSTVDEHLPPDALAFKMREPQWCLKQAEAIGPACTALIQSLFASRVMDNLRAAQGVVGFAKKYGKNRLEAACARALSFGTPQYRTVKHILQNGLDAQPQLAFGDELNATYTGAGRFTRHSRDLLH